MIPVAKAREPSHFHRKVRLPGLKWLQANAIVANGPPPAPAKLPPYWQKTSKQLWEAYAGVCAYLSVYFEWPLGASSTDHFVAKSRDAGAAYEWLNYRLACLGANRNKNRFDDILDPFEIEPDTFLLNLASGKIKPNPRKRGDIPKRAKETIERLHLDDPETNAMRAAHYEDFLKGDINGSYLQKHSPFVWYEAQRQGLL